MQPHSHRMPLQGQPSRRAPLQNLPSPRIAPGRLRRRLTGAASVAGLRLSAGVWGARSPTPTPPTLRASHSGAEPCARARARSHLWAHAPADGQARQCRRQPQWSGVRSRVPPRALRAAPPSPAPPLEPAEPAAPWAAKFRGASLRRQRAGSRSAAQSSEPT